MLRRIARAGCAVLALAAALAAALWFLRLELASRWLVRELAARGVPDASLRVTRLDARGVSLANVSLGPVFAARALAVELEPGTTVRMEEPRLRLDLRPGRPLLGELDAPLRLALAALAGGAGPPALPRVSISAAEIRLVQEGSEAVAELSLELDEAAGHLQLKARDLAWGELGLASASLDLPFRLSLAQDAVALEWTEPASAELAGPKGLPLALAEPVHIRSQRGRVQVGLGEAHAVRYDVALDVDLPALEADGAHVPPSRWRATATDGVLGAQVTALAERVRAEVSATLEPLRVRAVLAPLAFAPGGLQPADLDPRLAVLNAVRGRVSGNAELRWSDGRLSRSRGSLKLESLAFSASGAAVEGLGGAIRLTSLAPLASAPGQTLDAAALQLSGIRFTKPHVRFALGADGVHVEEARLGLGKGSIRVADVRLGPAPAARDLTLRLSNLDLAELLELADLEGVAGSGTISGVLPLRVSGETLALHAGRLEATGPGTLRIRSERVRSALGSAGATLEQLVAALADFHYDTLWLELEKPASGASSARLHVLGRNPAVLEGRAFDLNVNLETDLEPLLRALGSALRLKERWTRPAR